jgi:NTP pyrophosphatase (non-canonical NTP hydrolase)
MDSENIFRELHNFVAERDWGQFHTESNLAKSIAIEAAELLENFQWTDSPNRQKVIEELADVLTYCYLLSAKLAVEPNDIVKMKLAETKLKYPVSKSKGSSKKYDELDLGE